MSKRTWSEMYGDEKAIQFGIELEFTIDDDRAGITNNGHPGEAQAHHVAQALHRNSHCQQVRIAFECQSCIWNNNGSVQLCVFCRPLGRLGKIHRYTAAFPNANLPALGKDKGYYHRLRHFIIKPEMSLVMMQDHQKTPLELATPRQKVKEAVRSDFKEIRSVISGLGDLNFGIQFERTCGMHIHIGQEEPMNVKFARRVITMVALLEDRLLRGSLLTAERKQSHDNASIVRHSSWMTRDISPSGAKYKKRRTHRTTNLLMRQFFGWSEGHVERFCENDQANDQLFSFLCMLWRETTLEGIAEGLVGHTRNCGLRMHLRISNNDAHTRKYGYPINNSTFEFRYPAATMDPRLIGLWVQLCGSIVQSAWDKGHNQATKMEDMFKIFKAARGQPAWSTQERDALLTLFGQGDKVRLWNQLLGQLAANRDDSRDFHTRELLPQAGMLQG